MKPNASSIIAKDSRCCTLSGCVWKRYSKSFFNLKTSWIIKKWRDKKRRRIEFFCVTTSTPDLDPPHICQELWERSSEIQICHNCFSAWTCRRLHALSPAENNLPILEVVGEEVMEVGKKKVKGKWKQDNNEPLEIWSFEWMWGKIEVNAILQLGIRGRWQLRLSEFTQTF